MPPIVRTVHGDIAPDQLGLTLIHEHLVVDVREQHDHYDDTLEQIVAPMIPHLRAVRAQGVRTIVDCTPTHLGRHLDAYQAVANRTGLQVVMACGTYREAWLLEWIRSMPNDQLADWYEAGLEEGAGFIKLGCGPEAPTRHEARCARAAGTASRRTGALTACHVGHAAPANKVLDAFEAGGGDPGRFVVVHLQNEPDPAAHLALARRGVWLEYDAIGASPSDEEYARMVRHAADAGFLHRTLISQDACAYIVMGDGRAERQHRFDVMLGRFVPALRAAGFSQADVDQLLIENPARALVMNG